MATRTDNYGLIKPEGTDFYDIDDFNENADIIDEALHNLSLTIITANAKVIEIADWVSDAMFEDYPYKAEIAIDGVTAEYVPAVTFEPTVALSGKMCPVAQTDTNKVIVFASDIPESTVEVMSIVCRKEI